LRTRQHAVPGWSTHHAARPARAMMLFIIANFSYGGIPCERVHDPGSRIRAQRDDQKYSIR
jgi:hypothetical protein